MKDLVPHSYLTIIDLLIARSESHPDKPALTFVDDQGKVCVQLNYGALVNLSKRLATAISLESSPRDRVVLMLPQGPDLVVAFLACLLADRIAVPAFPPLRKNYLKRLEKVINDSGATLGLGNLESERASPIDLANDKIKILDFNTILKKVDREFLSNVNRLPEDVAFLQYTSGSTGKPKGVKVTHKNIQANLAMIYDSFNFHQNSVFVTWLPIFHDMGLIGGILQPLYSGSQTIIMNPTDFIQKPKSWLDNISNFNATITGAPNFAFEHCLSRIPIQATEGLDLSSLEVLFCGAEPIRTETISKFMNRFSSLGLRPDVFLPCYGLAEATLLVSGKKDPCEPTIISVNKEDLKEHQLSSIENVSQEDYGKVLPSKSLLMGCGKSPDQQSLAIVDPESHTVCSNGQIGEIWISGNHIAEGYWNRDDLDQVQFRAKLAMGKPPHGQIISDNLPSQFYLRTGDLGFLHESELFVTGRCKDLFIHSGRNYYLHDIEFFLAEEFEALTKNGIAAFVINQNKHEELGIAAEVERRYLGGKHEELARRINERVLQEYEIPLSAIYLVKPRQVLRTSSGKIRRQAHVDAFKTNALQEVYRWDRHVSTREKVSETRLESIPYRPKGALGIDTAIGSPKETSVKTESLTPSQTATVLMWLAERLGCEVNTESNLAELGFDSVIALELIAFLEEEFQLRLDQERFYQANIVRDLLYY